jgi:hypothetical protein
VIVLRHWLQLYQNDAFLVAPASIQWFAEVLLDLCRMSKDTNNYGGARAKTLSAMMRMLQLEDFDWPNSHYLNFVSINDFMCQEILYQSTI